ncbi:DUF3124 domain-containing protein [soil metagenome]
MMKLASPSVAAHLIRTALLVVFLLASPALRAAEEGSRGEIIYVPIYSSVFYQDGKRTLELAATLSIHNVDLQNSITVEKVDYYNTKGELIRKHLDKPVVLKPLETKNFVIAKEDTTGGTGANFLVEWQSPDQPVNSPIVEALMISAGSGQGISFTTAGRVIKKLDAGAK